MMEINTKEMYKLSYGLFVCTAVSGEKANGCSGVELQRTEFRILNPGRMLTSR